MSDVEAEGARRGLMTLEHAIKSAFDHVRPVAELMKAEVYALEETEYWRAPRIRVHVG